jgi:hypothetical protein
VSSHYLDKPTYPTVLDYYRPRVLDETAQQTCDEGQGLARMLLWRFLFGNHETTIPRMDGPDSRTDKHSITFRALLQPQFASKRPLLSHMDITGRQIWRTGIHPLEPIRVPPANDGKGAGRAVPNAKAE